MRRRWTAKELARLLPEAERGLAKGLSPLSPSFERVAPERRGAPVRRLMSRFDRGQDRPI
jgi:hypothetical protein